MEAKKPRLTPASMSSEVPTDYNVWGSKKEEEKAVLCVCVCVCVRVCVVFACVLSNATSFNLLAVGLLLLVLFLFCFRFDLFFGDTTHDDNGIADRSGDAEPVHHGG